MGSSGVTPSFTRADCMLERVASRDVSRSFIQGTALKFRSIEALERALKRTLKFIKEKLGDNISPTVLWTGYFIS